VPRPEDREEERKTIETRPNTVQLFVGIQLIARFTRDESETRRNNDCQDLTTEKRREKQSRQNQTQSNLSPEFIVPSDESEPVLGFGRVSPMPRPESDRDFSDTVVFGQKGSVLIADPVRVRSFACQLSVGSVCSYILTREMSGRTRD
jgi:hypothetical protein